MVVVISVVINEGDVMPSHIFTEGLRVNKDKFINILETLTKPWMDWCKKIAITSYRRTAHTLTTGRGHKGLLKENLLEVSEKEVLPPSLPNYNLLDYLVKGVSEL